jgi:hypothetical protein
MNRWNVLFAGLCVVLSVALVLVVADRDTGQSNDAEAVVKRAYLDALAREFDAGAAVILSLREERDIAIQQRDHITSEQRRTHGEMIEAVQEMYRAQAALAECMEGQ